MYLLLSLILSFRPVNSVSFSLINCYTTSKSFSKPIIRFLEASNLFSILVFTVFSSLIYKPKSYLKFSRSCLIFSNSVYMFSIIYNTVFKSFNSVFRPQTYSAFFCKVLVFTLTIFNPVMSSVIAVFLY